MRLRCSLWYLVRGIVLYPLVGSCVVLLVVLWLVLACLSCRSSIVVGQELAALAPCRWSLVLSSCGTSCSRSPCLLAALVGCLVVPVACGCLIVPRVATPPPVGTFRRPDWRPSGGGGDFSKRGERQTETQPVPIFMREVKKNVVFQRKTGEIQRKTGYEERRKRKSRSRDRGYEGEVTVNGAGQTDKKQSGLTL